MSLTKVTYAMIQQSPINVVDLGADSTGVADSTAAIQEALNSTGFVYLPKGTYKITAQLVFGANCAGLYGDGQYASVISKAFNGNAILCDTNGATITNIGIIGNGATYSGAGIVPRGYNILIQHCRITDTQGSCIYPPAAVSSNALAATYLKVDSCFLSPTDATTTYSISGLGTDASLNPTCRVFSNLSGGSSLVDFSGMNYAVLQNSLGTLIKFDANCSKIVLQGNRFTNAAANITIYGQTHQIENNLWGFGAGYGLTVDSTAAAVYFGPNNPVVIDGNISSVALTGGTGAAFFNYVYTELKTYTPTWSANVTNPVIGNGTLNGYYKLSGSMCFADINLLIGSTTTTGSGTYTFQLPFKAFVTATGSVRITIDTGVNYIGTLVLQGGTSTGLIYVHGQSQQWSDSQFTLATSTVLNASINYMISPT
jgi:hypothetical protein